MLPEVEPTPEAATAAPLRIDVTDRIAVGEPGSDPVADIPVQRALRRGPFILPLYERAAELARPGRAVAIHLAADSPITRRDWTGIYFTLGQAGFTTFEVHLGPGDPLQSRLPRFGDPDPDPVAPRVAAATLTLGRDARGPWAGLSATWSEAPGHELATGPRLRAPLAVSLATEEGCRVEVTSDAIDARLRRFDLKPPLRLVVTAPEETRSVQEVALSRELQSRGWSIVPAGLTRPGADIDCADPVTTPGELGAARARFEEREAGSGTADSLGRDQLPG